MSSLNEHEQWLVSNVDEHGCAIISVFDPEHEVPNFAYSIGFPRSLGQGDVLISGLDLDMMKRLLNDAFALCRAGLQLTDFARTSELFSSLDCVVREIAEEHIRGDFITSALWYTEKVCDQPFTSAFQLVWPDKAGLFPWDEGFAENLIGAQLELWRKETVN
jgi:Domain of unknown function (DUF4262)